MKSSIGMYADDTVIYFSATSPDLITQVLQNDLNYVEQWLQENKSVLNQSKTNWMLGKNQNTPQTLQYNLIGKTLN